MNLTSREPQSSKIKIKGVKKISNTKTISVCVDALCMEA
jgi:hypothetical protein